MKTFMFSLILLLLMWASPPLLFSQAPTSTCATPIELTTSNCGTATSPNTPSGLWGTLPASGIQTILYGFPGGAFISTDFNCLSDDVDPIENLEIRLSSSSFVSGSNACYQYLQNVYDVRDSDGNESLNLITILVEFTGCSSDTEAPVVSCTEFTATFNNCPTGFGPNTPDGSWVSIPPTGMINNAVGGIFTSVMDVSSCITDNSSSLGDMEYSLVSSYSENASSCSIDIINEFGVRDACGNVAASTFQFRGTIVDNNPITQTPSAGITCGETFTMESQNDYIYTVEPPSNGVSSNQDCRSAIIWASPIFETSCGDFTDFSITFSAESSPAPSQLPDDLFYGGTSGNPMPTFGPAFGFIPPSTYFYGSETTCAATTRVTYNLTDECGKTFTCFFFIEVEDNQDPIPNCNDISINLGGPGPYTLSQTDIDALGAGTTDNCGIDATSVTVTPSSFTSANVGNNTVTYSVSDNCGNTAFCTANVEVVCELTVDCSSIVDQNLACRADLPPVDFNLPIVVDSCGNYTLSALTIIPGNSGCPGDEVIVPRTYFIQDAGGNMQECMQTFTIESTIAPTITCPASVTLACGEDTSPANTGLATGSASCGNFALNITFEDVSTQSTSGCNQFDYTITRTWKATDDCGRETSCDQTITVQDNEAPVVTCVEFSETFNRCPDPLGPNTPSGNWISIPSSGIILTAVGGSSVSSLDLGACITDNCNLIGDLEYTITRSFEENRVPGCSVDILNEYQIRDACGNVSPELILFRGMIRFDGPPPLITAPIAFPVECGMSTMPSTTGTATATSGCGTPVITFSDQFAAGCGLSGIITRTWLATDGCGKTSSATQLIVITDNTPPTFSGAPDITVNCDENTDPGSMPSGMAMAMYTGAPQSWPTSQTGPVASLTADISGVPSGATITDVDISINVDHSWVGDLELELVSPDGTSVPFLTDPTCAGSGNSDNVSATFDDEAAGTASALCAGGVNNSATSPALCPSNFASAAAISGSFQPDVPFTAFDGGNPNGTWTLNIVDDAGGDAGCAHNFSVTLTWENLVTSAGGTGFPTVMDDCSLGQPTVSYSDDVRPGSCPGNYSIRRTWTATDDCMNSSNYLQIITVEDVEGPVFSEPAGALDASLTNVDLNAFGSGLCLNTLDVSGLESAINAGLANGDTGVAGLSFPTPTDACSDPITTTATAVVNPGTATCLALIDVTYTSIDACMNSSTFNQQLSITDVVAPVLTAPAADVTVECDMPTNVAATGTPSFEDECPGSVVTVTHSDVEVADPTCPNGKTITRTFIATDPCGNTTPFVQIITVVDTEAPIYTSFPRDTTVECSTLAGMGNNATNAKSVADAQGLPVVEDYCSSGLAAPFTDVFTPSINCPTVGIYQRIFAAIDDGCGNILPSRILTITIIDTLAPIFTSIPLGGDFDCTVGIPPVGSATAVDCDPNVVVTEVDVETNVGINQVVSITERTITARDICGNETTQVETYRTLDEVGPFLLSCPDDLGPFVARPDDRAQVTFTTPVFDDNCSFSVSGTHISGQDFPVGLTQVVFTAVDGGGNVTICEFTVEVIKALNLTCLDQDISIDNPSNLTRSDINFPYAATDCDACPQGEPLPSLDYLGYFRGHRYYASIPGDTRSWTEAQRYAVSLGGRLVEINSLEENRFLQRESPHYDALIGHYTGPRTTTWTGTFSPEIYENWASGFPTVGTNEFFALLNSVTGTHSNANHSEMPYIIEFPCVEIDVIDMPSDSLFDQGTNCVVYTAVDLCGNRDTCHYTFGVNTFDVNYCTPTGNEISQEEDYYITGVSMGAFAKTLNANDIYLQLRDTVELVEDDATPITLTAETSGIEGSTFAAYWRVWVDANKDGDFYDNGEMIYEAWGNAAHRGSFMLPSNLASVSPTRIRIGYSRFNYPEPCGDNPFGAIVDFTMKSNSTTLPRLALAGARGVGMHTLTTSSVEDPQIDRYMMLRGASPDDLTKIDFWDAAFGNNQRHEYSIEDLDPMPSAYYQAVALDDRGFLIRSSNIIQLTLPTRRDPVRIFPNPAVHQVYVDFGHVDEDTPTNPKDGNGDIILFDPLGRMIQSQSFELGVKRISVQLPTLATGTYMLRITRPNKQAKNVRLMIDQSGETKVTGA